MAAALDAGVPVLVVGGLPGRARGLADADAAVAQRVAALGPRVVAVAGDDGLADALTGAGGRRRSRWRT